jgi:hypothetical protein
MKKLILTLAILMLSWMMPSIAYAGSLNTYENEVIAAVQGVFEVDGIKYKANSVYLDQLIAYLSKENVDLTKEQRNEVLRIIQSNVATAVKEGYLVPLEEQQATEETEDPKNLDSEDVEAQEEEPVKPIEETNTNTLIQEISDRIESEPDSVQDTGQASATTAADNNIIKNTGFNLNRTIVMSVGIGLLMMICMIATFRFKLFAQNDE